MVEYTLEGNSLAVTGDLVTEGDVEKWIEEHRP